MLQIYRFYNSFMLKSPKNAVEIKILLSPTCKNESLSCDNQEKNRALKKKMVWF